MLAGHGKSSIRPGHVLCVVVVETAVIFSKSLTAHHSRDNCTRHTQTWHVEGGRRACFNNQPSPDLPVAQSHLNPQTVRPTPHACVSKVADGSRRYKKTCPSRSKERHSCQLVTCTSSRQASSSARASCEPASPAFRNEHHPAHPHRDIDAFAH